jgi:hypothetical protein
VEDRIDSGLYVELGDMEVAGFAAGRAQELLRSPGVGRVSWWENLAPGRTELPMEVPDGALLAVAELGTSVPSSSADSDRSFSPPPPLSGFVAHHFRRFPRPGQGILTGRPTKGLLVVWISPQSPSLTRALRDWADFVHIRHIAAAALPGFTHITVYENQTGGDPLFMHLYELDTEDVEECYGSMARLVARRLGGPRSDEFREWADYGAAGGHLFYCNTFRLRGALTSEGAPAEAASSTASAGT